MTLIHNEGTKLTASWFNTPAAATIVTGVIAPVFGVPTSATISMATLPSRRWLGSP
jgi:hypothetical protein